jgi:sugar diacid utilization regulator
MPATSSMTPEWLRLLASSATSGELQTYRDTVLTDAPSEVERAARAEEAALADQIHHMLVALNQRAEQAEALSDLASRLVSLEDLDDVLHEVVRQARRLVGADVSYLTLPQPPPQSHLFRIRGLDGAVSATFRNLLIPVEVGAAGRAYATGTPYHLSDYFSDTSILHTPATDDAVEAEGIVAKLAAPLRLSSQVIGTLVVAQRRRRVFAAADIVTVSAFATHAALAISKARLVADLNQSVSRLNEVNAELMTERRQMKQALAFHEELNRLTLAGEGGVPKIVALLGEATSLETAYFDAHDALQAVCPAPGRDPRLAELARRGGISSRYLAALREAGSVVVDIGPGPPATLVLVASGDEHLGMIGLSGTEPVSEAELLLAERAALVAAVILTSQRATRETETRQRLEILGELLGTGRNMQALHRRAQLIGLDPDTPKVVATFSGAMSAQARADITAMARSMAGLAGYQGGSFIVVVSSSDVKAVGAELKKVVDRSAKDVVVGLAGPATGLASLARLYADACRCAALLQALGRRGEVAAPADLSFHRFLFAEASSENLTAFVDTTIGELRAYDAEHATDLVRTLLAFLDCGRHHAETSRRLHIHHNTLHQRLRRLDEVMGVEWRDPLHSLELHVALQVQQLMSTTARSAGANVRPGLTPRG